MIWQLLPKRILFYFERDICLCNSCTPVLRPANPFEFILNRGRDNNTAPFSCIFQQQGGASQPDCAALPVPLQCCHYSFTTCPSSSRHNLNRGIAHDRKQ